MTDIEETFNIRASLPEDATAIAKIYNHYISNTIITFEEQPVSPSEFSKRIQKVQSASLPWLIAEKKGEIIGYAYANKWKHREAYRYSAEVSVYISPEHYRQKNGLRLYKQLLSELKENGIHTAIGGIALPNNASVGLHEKLGFKKTAHFKEVGFKFQQWIDVGYWQLLL